MAYQILSQPLFVCLFGLQVSVYCVSSVFTGVMWKQMLANPRAPALFSDCLCPFNYSEEKTFYCYGQCTQHPRQRGKEQAVSVSSSLRVMWLILQKGHCQLCPAVCTTLLTSLVFVHLFLPSSLSFIFFLSFLFHVVLSPFAQWIAIVRLNTAICSLDSNCTFRLIQCDTFGGALIAFFTLGCPKPTENITDPVYYLSSQWMFKSLKQ